MTQSDRTYGRSGAPADAAAFVTLLEGQKGTLLKVAALYCRTPEDRRDLIQDIILQMWRAFPQFDGRAGFGTWTYRIAMNVAISSRRSARRRIGATLPVELALEVADEAAETPEEAARRRALHMLIDALDAMNKALAMLYLDGFSHTEIAEMLGTTPGNVGTRLGRIKTLLQRQADTGKGLDDGSR